jgi:predicted ATP-grasp superfamily ATP-dependent carboligase
MTTSTIGAVVIGGEHPGLGIARSLGRRGIPVCVIDDQHSISSFSRYVREVVRVRDLRDEHRTVENVLEVGHRLNLRGWVLFPTRDETVAAFSRHRNRLAEFFRVSTPAWETTQWAWDKKNTYERAAALRIPCPRTYNPRTESELEGLYQQLPLAIKPAVKENFFYATGAKAWRAETPEQLRRYFAKAASQIRPEEILVQEIIPGDGDTQYSYCAFFRDGAAHSTLIAKRMRQHPREFGRAATYVETVCQPQIEELATRFLKAIEYYGLVEIEFKQDPRDGEFKLLDVNARTWGFHILGRAAGVDFPYILYADQLGLPTQRSTAKIGVGWLRVVTDVPTVASDILSGNLSLRKYYTSLVRTGVESVFCKEDPMPSVGEVVLLPYLFAKKYLPSDSSTHKPKVSTDRQTAGIASNQPLD